MTTGLLHLSFSETVDQSSFAPSSLVLQSTSSLNSQSKAVSYFQIPNIAFNFKSTTEVEFTLTEIMLNQIKVLDPKIGSGIENTYISSLGNFISDTSGNALGVISNSSAEKATSVTPDDIRPELRSFTLNMNDGTVLFSFTESVVPSTFNLSGVVFAVSSAGGKQHSLQKEQEIMASGFP
jgi:hypothetical protein